MTAPVTQGELSPLGRAAVRYAERGWAVFPLQPRGKIPLLKGAGGFLSATADVAQVRAWWTEYPTANIGLWPGQSGFVVLDVDGPDGDAAARQLGACAEPTLVCVSGRDDGGRHLYFRRPPFSVSNVDLAPKLEVRGDAGYVVLPPSVHPSGRQYVWLGKADEIRDVPPAVLAALEAAQSRVPRVSGGTPGDVGRRATARELVLGEPVGEGGRNVALTRIAGRLLAKGIPDDEALVLVSGANRERCRPPLPQHEVNAIVANVAAREAAKPRPALALVADSGASTGQDAPPPPPSAADIASAQVERAKALLARDLSSAPRWAWPDVAALAGPLLPGDLVIVGSLMGNGKSTFLMSQMQAFAGADVATYYVPLEVDPEVNRLRWAAWTLGLDVRHAIRQDWARLPEGSAEAIQTVLDEQAADPRIHFCDEKRITLGTLAAKCRWAVDEAGCRVVMLDHLHRMDFGADASAQRVAVTETARRLKDLGRVLGVPIVASAQLNRSNDPIDAYSAPGLARLKESAGIAEEADVVLMLSRRLKRDLPDKWERRLRVGELSELDLAEPNTMVVTCRKHRLDNDALNHAALLAVENGRLVNRAPSWRVYP